MVRIEVGAMLYILGLPHELGEQAKQAFSGGYEEGILILPCESLPILEDGLQEAQIDYRIYDKPHQGRHQYRSVDYDCVGCNDPVGEDAMIKLWVDTPLGTTVLRCHEGCEEPAVRNCREQPATIARNQRQALNMMKGNK